MVYKKASFISLVKVISILLICFLGFNLRSYHYSSVPKPGDSLDEYANAWSGLGLIKVGIPIGWSYLESSIYPIVNQYINIDNIYQTGGANGNPFSLHYPWLDHPPGMGILTGGFAYIKGARVLEDASTVVIRKPMLYLGALNILLLFFIGYLYFNYKTGLIASIIYSVSPLIVVANRLPQSENGFVPLFLLSVIFIKLFQNKNNYLYLFFAAIISGTGIWFKIPALMITISGLLLILFSSPNSFKKQLKPALIFTIIAISFGVFPLLAYGIALNPQAFFQVLFFHSQRAYGIGLSAIYKLFTQSKITGSIFLTDGWLVFGWLSWLIIMASIKKQDQKSILNIPLLVCLMFFIFLGSEFYGWYVFPFFPWLVLSIAVMFNSNEKTVLSVLSVLVTLPPQVLLSKLASIYDFSNIINIWRLILPTYLLFITICYLNQNQILIKIQKILIYIWFALAILLSIKYVYCLSPIIWPSIN